MRFWWGLVNNLVNKITQKALRFKAFKRREYYHIYLRFYNKCWGMRKITQHLFIERHKKET